LNDLPPPPAAKVGWPWTVETTQIPKDYADSSVWPKISIVTPSYNQGRFIEETIRSVLLQRYPNLEFRVVDGGSTDETVAIIRKYERWISAWSSGPDRGQIDALNRSLPEATGEIMTWLNSDDLLLPGALFTVASLHRLNPNADIISGARLQRSAETGIEVAWVPWLDKWPLISVGFAIFPQESTFFSRRVWNAIGRFDETLNYGFDGAFFSQAASCAEQIMFTGAPLAVMHAHREQKSLRNDEASREEAMRVNELYRSRVPWFCKVLVRMCFTRFAVIGDALLRCIIYPRARRKFQIGNYDWAEDKWVLTSF